MSDSATACADDAAALHVLSSLLSGPETNPDPGVMAAVPADLLDYLNTHMPRRSGGINATSTWKTRSFALSWTAHTAEEHTGLAYATTVLYPALGAAASQGRVDLAKVFRMKAAQ